MQDGNKRCTKVEHAQWQVANGLHEGRSQAECASAKRKRLGKSLQKDKRLTAQLSSSTEIPLTNNIPNSPDPKPSEGNIWNISSEEHDINTGTEQKILSGDRDKAVFTQSSDPFKVEHVNEVLSELTIGDDLTEKQCISIDNLLRKFADCFALSMSEVMVVAGATHKLHIPNGTTFKKKVNQRPLSGPQKEYFNGVLNKMLEAGIIAPISHSAVKCCGATTLAKKAHEGIGLNLEELQHRVNDECITARIPSAFKNLPPRNSEWPDTVPEETQTKW
ncbi:hypothetical protein L208DRAFT_1531951 [Tricholoma matsutake]|nr:hypothetical protein L208DRAFT_1531951 [Tricholoma matsutake 945]